MFVVQANDGQTIEETPEKKWLSIPDGIESVHLIHPAINVSVAAHGYDRYAFLCEGVAILQTGEGIQRLREHVWAEKPGMCLHISVHQSGKVCSEIIDTPPELADNIWRHKDAKDNE